MYDNASEFLYFVPKETGGMFTSVGDLFTFVGLLVCIGAIGVYAIYRLIREFYYNDR
jgi:hypothetical protein